MTDKPKTPEEKVALRKRLEDFLFDEAARQRTLSEGEGLSEYEAELAEDGDAEDEKEGQAPAQEGAIKK